MKNRNGENTDAISSKELQAYFDDFSVQWKNLRCKNDAIRLLDQNSIISHKLNKSSLLNKAGFIRELTDYQAAIQRAIKELPDEPLPTNLPTYKL